MAGKELAKIKVDSTSPPSAVRKEIAKHLQADNGGGGQKEGQVATGLVHIKALYAVNGRYKGTEGCCFVYSPDIMATYPEDERMGEYKGKDHRWVNLANDAEKAVMVITPVGDDCYTITNQTLNEYLYASPFNDQNYGGTMENNCHGGMRRWVHTHLGEGYAEDNPAAVWWIPSHPDGDGTFHIINKHYDELLYVTQFMGPRGKEVHTFPDHDQGKGQQDQGRFAITPIAAENRTQLILPDMSLLRNVPDSISIAEAFGIKGEK